MACVGYRVWCAGHNERMGGCPQFAKASIFRRFFGAFRDGMSGAKSLSDLAKKKVDNRAEHLIWSRPNAGLIIRKV